MALCVDPHLSDNPLDGSPLGTGAEAKVMVTGGKCPDAAFPDPTKMDYDPKVIEVIKPPLYAMDYDPKVIEVIKPPLYAIEVIKPPLYAMDYDPKVIEAIKATPFAIKAPLHAIKAKHDPQAIKAMMTGRKCPDAAFPGPDKVLHLKAIIFIIIIVIGGVVVVIIIIVGGDIVA